jgi:DNA topoisomerase-2
LINKLANEWTKLDNQVRFILAVVKEEIIIRNRKRADLLQELIDKKFDQFIGDKKVESKSIVKVEDEDEEGSSESEDESDKNSKKKVKELKSGYDYLLKMPLWSLTLEKVLNLQLNVTKAYYTLGATTDQREGCKGRRID